MAVVRLVEGGDMVISAERGAIIWQVLNGEIEGDEKDQAFASLVSRIYLNWRNAPDSYIEDRFEVLIPMMTNDWLRNDEGVKLKPWKEFDWDIAKKWGLWENGHKSGIVDRPEAVRNLQKSMLPEARKDLA